MAVLVVLQLLRAGEPLEIAKRCSSCEHDRRWALCAFRAMQDSSLGFINALQGVHEEKNWLETR